MSSKVSVNCLQFCRWTVFKNRVFELSCQWTVSILAQGCVWRSISTKHFNFMHQSFVSGEGKAGKLSQDLPLRHPCSAGWVQGFLLLRQISRDYSSEWSNNRGFTNCLSLQCWACRDSLEEKANPRYSDLFPVCGCVCGGGGGVLITNEVGPNPAFLERQCRYYYIKWTYLSLSNAVVEGR